MPVSAGTQRETHLQPINRVRCGGTQEEGGWNETREQRLRLPAAGAQEKGAPYRLLLSEALGKPRGHTCVHTRTSDDRPPVGDRLACLWNSGGGHAGVSDTVKLRPLSQRTFP